MSGKRHGFHVDWLGGLRRRRPLKAARRDAHRGGGWSLDLSEPCRPGALPHRHRYCFRTCGSPGRSRGPTRRPARPSAASGDRRDVGHRGHPRPLRAAARHRPSSCAGQLLPRRQTTPYGRRSAPRAPAPALGAVIGSGGVLARQGEVAAFNSEHPHTKRGLAVTPVKSASRSISPRSTRRGALVHSTGRLGADHHGWHPRWARPSHQDAAGRRHSLGFRRAACGWRRRVPTRCQHLRHRGQLGRGPHGRSVKHACEQIRERLAQVAATHAGRQRRRRPHRRRHRPGGGRVRGRRLERSRPRCVFPRVQLFAAGLHRTEDCTGTRRYAGFAVQVFRVRIGGRSRSGRLQPAPTGPAGGHRARRR